MTYDVELKPGIEMQGEYKGFDFVVMLQEIGHRCGYVRIPEGHPLFGKDYSDPLPGMDREVLSDDEEIGKRGIVPVVCFAWSDSELRMDVLFNVHGSITFAGPLHNVETPDGVAPWWIGFDCAHSGDAPEPELSDPAYSFALGDMGVVRSRDYVFSECKSLVDQILKYYPEVSDGDD